MYLCRFYIYCIYLFRSYEIKLLSIDKSPSDKNQERLLWAVHEPVLQTLVLHWSSTLILSAVNEPVLQTLVLQWSSTLLPIRWCWDRWARTRIQDTYEKGSRVICRKTSGLQAFYRRVRERDEPGINGPRLAKLLWSAKPKAVTVYFKSEELLSCDFAMQHDTANEIG